MPIVAQSIAIAELRPHLAALDGIVRGAWSDVAGLPTDAQLVMCARTKASLVHDYMLARASKYADSTSSVQYFQRQGMHGLLIDGRYAIRFKKLDEDSLSKNQPTLQVAEFRAQIELDGIEAAHHLEVGYVTDDWAQEVADVRVTCPSGRGNAWAVSISQQQASTVVADIFGEAEHHSDVEDADIEPRASTGKVIKFKRDSSDK